MISAMPTAALPDGMEIREESFGPDDAPPTLIVTAQTGHGPPAVDLPQIAAAAFAAATG